MRLGFVVSPLGGDTVRHLAAGASLVLLGGLGWGQAAEPLVLEDFSQPVAGRWKGRLELTEAEGGQKVGRWQGAREGEQLSLVAAPKDWTAHKALDLWVWSATANKQEFMLVVYSENLDTQGPDYFYRRIVVDWEGWKQLAFALSGLKTYRTPSWSQVGSLTFSTTGWGIEAKPDTDLCLGEIRLLTEVPEGALPRADVVADFEEDDIEIKPEDLRSDLFCASGPGGQKVNKTESAVRLTHLPTGIVVQSQDERSQHRNREKAMAVLKARILDARRREEEQKMGATRRSMIGSGDRSERIRTYNFPQNRVTDHRINLTLYSLNLVMEGRIEELIGALRKHDTDLRLQAQVGG
jgi:hypothetical protein